MHTLHQALTQHAHSVQYAYHFQFFDRKDRRLVCPLLSLCMCVCVCVCVCMSCLRLHVCPHALQRVRLQLRHIRARKTTRECAYVIQK